MENISKIFSGCVKVYCTFTGTNTRVKIDTYHYSYKPIGNAMVYYNDEWRYICDSSWSSNQNFIFNIYI